MSEILDDMFDEALRFEQEEHVEREYEIEYKDKQISSLKAALKEKDAEITALKKRIEEMKCCGNCNQGRPDKEECAIFCKRDGSGNLDRWEARG